MGLQKNMLHGITAAFLCVSLGAHALVVEKKQIRLESLEDYGLCHTKGISRRIVMKRFSAG